MDPPTVDGLDAVPPSWRALTGLSALTLTGHHSLRRLPHWIGELTCLRVRLLRQMRRRRGEMGSLDALLAAALYQAPGLSDHKTLKHPSEPP